MFVRILTPKGCLHVQEESWNAFPYCRTILSNEFLGERLVITVDSIHLPDRGETENALNLPPEKLQQREVIFLDIAQDQGAVEEEANYADTKIDSLCSRRAGRGPLRQNWMNDLSVRPVMTCYKLVTIDVRIFGLTGRLESFIVNNQRRVFTQFQRRMVILMDAWYGMTMEDIRRLENVSAKELDHQRQFASARGTRMSASSQGGGGELW